MPDLEGTMNNVENLETGGETKEFANSTEICNFEGCTLLNNEQLAGYLNETLPPSHLEGCPSIEFDPHHCEFINDSCTLGFYECGSRAIHIADETRFSEGAEGMLDTVVHEVGHNAYAGIIETNSELAAKWEALNARSWQELFTNGTGFVSNYAMTNLYEDFAESYRAYVRDPEMLQIMSPEKYDFLRDYAFFGREYLTSTPLHPLDEDVGRVLDEAKQRFDNLSQNEKDFVQRESVVSPEEWKGPPPPYRCFEILASS